eukprot:scaffold93685_cov49-Attheya_sp.AAC.1
MAAPYHADATDVRSGAPSIPSHTPNCHADGTSGVVYSSVVQGDDERSLLSDLEGVALFGEGVLSSYCTKRRAVASNRHPKWWYSVLCHSYSYP